VSVSTQTDLPETSCQCLHKPICWRRRVSVYTNRFAGDMSCQCLHKPICWRHVVSVSTQTDFLEKCRVSVYTNRFAGEMSCQCLHKPICWRNVVSVSTQTDLLEKCRVGVYADAVTVKRESPCVHIWRKKYLTLTLKTFTLKMKGGCSSETFSPTSQTKQQHMHRLRHIHTTRFFCGLSALSYFIVDLHHCLFSNTKHKSILLIIPTF